MTRTRKVGVSVLVLSAVLAAACGGGEAPAVEVGAGGAVQAQEGSPFLNVRGPADFVGDAACADCHEDQYRGFLEHGMAQSYYPLTPENAVEDFSAPPLYHAGSDLYYRVYREGDRFFQEEYRPAEADGKEHRLVREMQYVVGSGSAARTYLTEHHGRLYELPLTWYTQPRRWGFSPGYEKQNQRFDRLIPARCMACHNNYPEAVPFVEGKYTAVPHGIGCERCHGPGSLHVEERLADPEPADTVDYTIVNPAHLSLARRLDVCQQCHLQGTVSILREGRDPFGFRPSQDLSAYMSVFAEDAARDDEIAVISHADRMQRSACFQVSGVMDCTTCHDPHAGFRAEGPAYFNDTCETCHAPAALSARFSSPEAQRTHRAGADCIACHMPKVVAEDVTHASFTDHWIRVVDASVPAPMKAHAPVTLQPHFARDAERPEGAVYEGMAYVVYGRQHGDRQATEKGIAVLEAALARQPEHGEGQYLLGFAHMQLGRPAEAVPALEAAVRLDPDIPERLNTLAQAYEATGRDAATIERLYRRALDLQPALADVRINYGRFLEAQGRLDEAVEAYRQAAAEQPWLEVAHYNLGTAYLRLGRVDEAEGALLQAVELDPDYADALGNLGLLYASRGRPEQALAHFERAAAAAPESPVALGNLGAFHLNQGDLPRAVDLLRQAVRLDPQYVDALVNLALAYLNLGDEAQARQYARQALTLNPSHPTARQILGALN